jgi:hypothetical protein
MKTLVNKISKLSDQIELGLLSKLEAMQRLRELKHMLSDKYNEGSDEYMTIIYTLIDVNTLIQDIY